MKFGHLLLPKTVWYGLLPYPKAIYECLIINKSESFKSIKNNVIFISSTYMLVDVFIQSSKSLVLLCLGLSCHQYLIKKKDVMSQLMLRLLGRDEVYHLSLFLNSSRARWHMEVMG